MGAPQVASSPSPAIGVGMDIEGLDVRLAVGHVLHVKWAVVRFGVEQNGVRYGAELTDSVVVAAGALPGDLVAKILRTKNSVHQDF